MCFVFWFLIWRQVSDARRAYETKSETKPTVFPALKVSDAKKAFEVAASAAAAAATPSKIPVGHNHNRFIPSLPPPSPSHLPELVSLT